MTSSSDPNPESDGKTSVAISAMDQSDLAGFFPKAEPGDRIPPRKLRSLILDYSAHAAMIVGLLGFAWTVSNHVVSRPTADKLAQSAAAAPVQPAKDDVADLRQANRQMAEELTRLRTNIETLRTAVREDKTSTQVRVLQAGLENVRTETTSAVAQLNGKLEKVEKEPLAKIQQLNERLGRVEKGNVDLGPTGSIAPATVARPVASAAPSASAKAAANVPTPPMKPAAVKLASAEDPHRLQDGQKVAEDAPGKPQILTSYVVRDVYDGVAIIEGRRGPMEVVPGVSIPGAGIVKSIDRQGKGWTVTTTKGLLAYVAPPKEYRRPVSSRDYYPDYRNDF